jgi:hypothetical protein
MQGVSRGQVPVAQDDLLGAFRSLEIYSDNFIDCAEQCVESGLYRVAAVNGEVGSCAGAARQSNTWVCWNRPES